jgi:hypothetical protein
MDGTTTQVITVKGKSQHGKQRVKQWGSKWEVIEKRGRMLLVVAVGDKQRESIRWVEILSDADMTILYGV